MDFCPACGFEQDEPPWRGEAGSLEICACCGLQFGYDDACGGSLERRTGFYQGWRAKWRLDGYQWWSTRPPPAGWSPQEQLANRDF
jgi:hypothetical protein